MNEDIIAAIATGLSDAGIGIIRISGINSGTVIEKIFRTRNGKKIQIEHWKTHTIHYGFIVDPKTDEKLDEVLVSWMMAPRSYTAEDTVEINTHGGAYVIQRVLSVVLENGARMAEPGEFTKRAFLHGRIDLSQAESVMNLIQSQNEYARKTALSQMQGSVYNEITSLREEILYDLAFIESALDDPDDYSLDGFPKKLEQECHRWIQRLDTLIQSYRDGKILREGIRTVIVGRPNTGKSSLLNTLTHSERAIVSPIPGTTRDTIEETVRLNDLTIHLLDTAGIRSTQDPVEKIGVSRAREAMETAQLILFVMDASQAITKEDREIAKEILQKMNEGVPCIVLLNKSDLPQIVQEQDVKEFFKEKEDFSVLTISLKEKTGIDALEERIIHLFHLGKIAESSNVILSSEREKAEAEQAVSSLKLVMESIHKDMSEEFYAVDLQDAYASLGKIIGKSVSDDVINEVFSKFCMGK